MIGELGLPDSDNRPGRAPTAVEICYTRISHRILRWDDAFEMTCKEANGSVVEALFEIFEQYKAQGDFPGMDMAYVAANSDRIEQLIPAGPSRKYIQVLCLPDESSAPVLTLVT